MSIIFHESTKVFHLHNDVISYIMMVLPNGQMGHLYFGKKIHDREDFGDLLETAPRPMCSCPFEGNKAFSLEGIKQELPSYGTGDYRSPAVEVIQENGSRISDFQYHSHHIEEGKPKLPGLPATYVESKKEAETLVLNLFDSVTGIWAELFYTIFADGGIVARSVRYLNGGEQAVQLGRAMSLCLDLPDCDYDWVQFSGAWARERHIKERRLTMGIQSVGSIRGNSSHEHNPFLVLKRPFTDERQGEAIGFSFVYSGNFLMQAEVDAHDNTRVLVGIHPDTFEWHLKPEESFQAPETVMVYTDSGLNAMSQSFHKLFQKRLARGYWRDRVRPILINNWEATYFDFTEDKLVHIAEKAKECGVELFVLDDGWFGARSNEFAGLGDWVANTGRLANGITGLAERMEQIGMKFGLWFEPEMVNKDSDLYRSHPDWIIQVPGRANTHGRNQHVLDFSRKEVVDCIYGMMAKILSEAKVSYIKWDMNRSITENYSQALPADRQGELLHRYILGVYDLYDRLNTAFPHILFESCASGGGRFDPGLLYYAPQGWTSDDSDAIERLKIQYGTSFCYPVSSIGAHVSAVPNHQVNRITPLSTRANVACFGTFGYELDLNQLTEKEREQVREQIAFMKEYRQVLQFGDFYRLLSPFDSNFTAWMAVSQDKRTALAGWYKTLNEVNGPYRRIKLQGLNPEYSYTIDGGDSRFGDELMHVGLLTTDSAAGERKPEEPASGDFDSHIFVLKA